ncbi:MULTISPECIES: WGxxGxxG family protein [Paenibacillus]|uniref:WGxxGxxG family protein n=1 Tax=Paenibacillus TaxID=44249 RepID=UPI001F413A03|nr:WGxxGxxG family protein [Paenibacillus sp. JJ-223]CAH1190978.1 hypothetical protein PAECIP111890_00247 [Paenibacillus sp. JJ-223]
MKKKVTAVIATFLFVFALALPVSAQEATQIATATVNDQNTVYTHDARYNTNNVRANSATTTDNNRGIDWGWLGLLGLFGLAGMRKRVSDPDRSNR